SKAYWGYDAAFMNDVRSEMVVRPEQIRADWVYVLEEAGQICGYYDLEKRDADVVWLESLFIEPDAMGKGVGRRLWDHAVQTARALGFRYMDFESDPNAEGFYLKMGAVRVSARPKPISGQPDRVLPRMRMELRAVSS
ncbi:MAG: GNAT family N-acetyltransferase, partial [Anaerolineae bacterium]|nr:GNAT family N-acetyltransferase [Anaerolineae bacterium]